MVEDGLVYCRDSAERLFESELWRLKGELLLRRERPRGRAGHTVVRDAEACFETAGTVARAQGVAMLERRARRRHRELAPTGRPSA